jgi:3-oxoacyl-[acyl-carrier protein] reductase
MRSAEKVAVVTGASRETASRWLSTTPPMPGPQLPSSPRSNKLAGITVKADLAATGGVDRLFDAVAERFGRLDVVVHNAGIQLLGAHAEINDAALHELAAVNLTAAFRVLRRAANDIEEGGRITALSSGTTATLPPRYSVYAATKAAVETLVAVLAKEMRGRGISVNAIAPGPVATDLYLAGKTPEELNASAARSRLFTSVHPTTSPAPLQRRRMAAGLTVRSFSPTAA